MEGDVSIIQINVGFYEIFPSTLVCMQSQNHSALEQLNAQDHRGI